MSDDDGADDMMMLMCASCGIISEVDDIKLTECADCDLVKYCSSKCQKDHRPKHKRACKKRAAELRDELLFKQPDSSHLGDCPICCLPMPLDLSKSTLKSCCSKVICDGCTYANQKREMEERRHPKCPFCREQLPPTDEESDKRTMKRIETNNPVAMTQWGTKQHEKGDYSSAFAYYTKAAELGDAWAHYRLSLMYYYGHGVAKDKGKEMHHLEEAAIRGHPLARYNLACHEGRNRRHDRALKHLIIAATQGNDDSIKLLLTMFKDGRFLVSKDDLAAVLRAHQAAVDATKSLQREAAEELERRIAAKNKAR
eukprot:scaffold10229_cov129-Skeletonema_dohrnii-CCMP3373.AAC.1